MVGAAGLLSVLIGAALGYSPKRFPAHVGALETAAGMLLIGGLALAGCALRALV